LEAEELTVSLAYDFAYEDVIAGTTATAKALQPRISASQIAAFQSVRTDWQRVAERRLNEVIRLPVGWDGHQGKPVEATIATYAFGLLEALLTMPGVPLPSITPLSYGGLVLEWHRKGWDVEIEIDAPSSHHVYTRELALGIEKEFWLGLQLRQLLDVLKQISD
jgi:hypothetical protein